ncbi:hypothetical protein [Allocoleopsis franciscana]|uniref:Uncharacterized protein n=1 Tax=Allocoleopsis franciscana PCC 7113 TaxID=1173027 RepID=K9WQ39_9CYAN|nr:hypothetical protein [Allocoleopsis franciscana]AFZ22293.1 hypothetical protein Mic7113_6731 [Allocoleopsis franciscana PCC 7113]
MPTFTTSCKPLPFYADEPPLEELVDKFGSFFEALTPHDKLILLASIATNLAFHDTDETGEEWSLFDTYQELPCNPVNDELVDTLESLDNLQRDGLLGLCEALVAQIRYTKEVA